MSRSPPRGCRGHRDDQGDSDGVPIEALAKPGEREADALAPPMNSAASHAAAATTSGGVAWRDEK